MVSERVVLGGACGALLASTVLLLCFDQVDQNEYGLVFNWVTKQIRPQVYHGGTHMIGAWNKFITFPATVQTIEFSERLGLATAGTLHTRTKEGLGLQLSISFQYKLKPEDLPRLFALTNYGYEALYTRIARDQLLEAASEYEGPQYWLERKKIGDHMRNLVETQLNSSYASLWGLQLLIIDLPDQFEQSITKTQVQQQVMKTRQNEQVAASIRADTEVLQADFERKIAIVQAGAEANASLASRLADAEAKKRRIAAEAEVLGYLRERLKLSPNAAVEYQQLDAYAGLQNATFLANVLGATPVVQAAGAVGGETVRSFIQKGSLPSSAPSRRAGDQASSATQSASVASTSARRDARFLAKFARLSVGSASG
eukprot:TRINITY_DN64460_c0_g1_i1.p1 TRINITY_DN64460_c0_g1~~TRINITY_DN64460_c0_g1_i1.p1  ORF type:complete len:371 (+),score=73.26 TRINITY_DN64460_c0_g1_i1:138-1250(+)